MTKSAFLSSTKLRLKLTKAQPSASETLSAVIDAKAILRAALRPLKVHQQSPQEATKNAPGDALEKAAHDHEQPTNTHGSDQ